MPWNLINFKYNFLKKEILEDAFVFLEKKTIWTFSIQSGLIDLIIFIPLFVFILDNSSFKHKSVYASLAESLIFVLVIVIIRCYKLKKLNNSLLSLWYFNFYKFSSQRFLVEDNSLHSVPKIKIQLISLCFSLYRRPLFQTLANALSVSKKHLQLQKKY